MAANPSGAHKAGSRFRRPYGWPRSAVTIAGVLVERRIAPGTPSSASPSRARTNLTTSPTAAAYRGSSGQWTSNGLPVAYGRSRSAWGRKAQAVLSARLRSLGATVVCRHQGGIGGIHRMCSWEILRLLIYREAVKTVRQEAEKRGLTAKSRLEEPPDADRNRNLPPDDCSHRRHALRYTQGV
jgi:hypothetical protein